jgi:hypothetical protein
MWVDLMMQMQENTDGVEELTTPEYYSILDRLNRSIMVLDQFKMQWQLLDRNKNNQASNRRKT